MTTDPKTAQPQMPESTPDSARTETLVRLGPFHLSSEAPAAQLEQVVHQLARMLERLRTGTSTAAQENARLQAKGGQAWHTRLHVVTLGEKGGWKLLGFHVEAGIDYVTEEWPQIESEPPLVRPLIDALTEQIWWKLLEEYTEPPTWRPLFVLEWSAPLSQRAGAGLEGSVTLIRLELDKGATRHMSHYRLIGGAELERRLDRNPDSQEPLEMVLKPGFWWVEATKLERNPVVADPHRPAPVMLTNFDGQPVPILDGWLGAELERLPRSMAQRILAFYDQPLRVHGLRSARREQLFSAMYAVFLSFFLAAGVVLAVDQLSAVRTEGERRLGEPAPLPALSFCSEDNRRFVNSLRTWILRFDAAAAERLEDNADLTAAWCGLFDRVDSRGWNAGVQAAANACFDVLKTSTYGHTEESAPLWAGPGWGNPQVFFEDEQTRVNSLDQLVKNMRDTCRIVVRQHEGAMKSTIVQAHLSNALLSAHPVLYEAADPRPVGTPNNVPAIWRVMANPNATLPTPGEGAAAGTTSAPSLFGTPTYSASSVAPPAMPPGRGAPPSASISLPKLAPALSAADAEEGEEEEEDTDALDGLRGVAGTAWSASGSRGGEGAQATRRSDGGSAEARSDGWRQRYLRARFLPYDGAATVRAHTFKAAPERLLPQNPLWSCYLWLLPGQEYREIMGAERGETQPQLGLWTSLFTFPTDMVYERPEETVQSQIQLDADLGWLSRFTAAEDGPNMRAFQCWGIVRDELDRLGYQQVHPLIEAPEADWPRESQQLCGQVCMATYGIGAGNQQLSRGTMASWYASSLDMTNCLAPDRFRESPGTPGGTALELDMSWAGQRGPTPAQACAFHLLAQERFPAGEDKQTPLLNIPPGVWAGAGGSVGGTDSSRSFLVHYARQLVAYRKRGQNLTPPRSVDGCQHVAAQCMTTALLNTLRSAQEWGDNSVYIQDLRLKLVDEMARGAKLDPFCQLINDELQYLMKNDFKLDEKKAEDVCLSRIARTHEQVVGILDRLSWAR